MTGKVDARQGVCILFVVAIVVSVILAILHKTNPQKGTLDDSLSSDRTIPMDGRTMTVERKLQNGAMCRVVLKWKSPSTGAAERIDRMEVLLGGAPIVIPQEYLTDLGPLNVPDGVQIAEDGETKILMLDGGEGATRWNTSISIIGDHATQQTYRDPKGNVRERRNAQTLKVESNTFSSIEMDRTREIKLDSRQEGRIIP